jgi:ribosomal-protein-alanine N-acetyltransferase
MTAKSTYQFSTLIEQDLNVLMPIELACHSHPWSEKTFKSCIGGRYFGEKLHIENALKGFMLPSLLLTKQL